MDGLTQQARMAAMEPSAEEAAPLSHMRRGPGVCRTRAAETNLSTSGGALPFRPATGLTGGDGFG